MSLTKKIQTIFLLFIASIFLGVANNAYSAGIGTNVNQVKTSDSSAVYYLDYSLGLKKSYVNETSFLSYGNNWDDVEVVDADELDGWGDVSLIKTADNPAVYYINNNEKALILSSQDFEGFGFDWDDIVTVSQTDLDQYTTVSYEKIGLEANSDSEGLRISLNSESPDGGYLPANTNNNLVAIFNIEALNKMVEIESLSFELGGVNDFDIIENVYITNEYDVEYDISPYSKDRKVTFNFGNDTLLIGENKTVKIKVYVDVANYASCTNNNFKILIEDTSYIETEYDVFGSFPVESDDFNFICESGLLGQVTVEENSIDDSEVSIGGTEQIIGKFTISENSDMEDVIIEKLVFTNDGTADYTDLNNFKLKNESNRIIANVSEMQDNDNIVFNMDYEISSGSDETFTVLADILEGDSETIDLSFEDGVITGVQNGYDLTINYSNYSETMEIQRDFLGVEVEDLITNEKVFSEQSGVIIGNFKVKNNNQSIVLESLEFSLEKSANAPSLSETIYVVNYDTGEMYGYFDGNSFVNGLVDITLNNIDLNKNKDITFTLITDMPDDANNGDTYKVFLKEINYKAENNAYYSDYVDVPGIELIFSKSDLYVYPNNDLEELTYAKGEEGIKVASFILEAASGNDVVISSLSFTEGSDTSGIISYLNGFSNMYVKVGSDKSNTINEPTSNNYSFESLDYNLDAGDRVEVKVYVDTNVDLNVSEVQLKLTGVIATDDQSGIPTVITGLNTDSCKTSFYSVEAELEILSGGSVQAGEEDNLVASFSISNLSEEVLELNYITINTSDEGFSHSLGYSNLRIERADTGKTVGSKVSEPVAGANRMKLRGHDIEAGETAEFEIYVDADENVEVNDFEIYLSNLEAEGKDSDIEAEISGNGTSLMPVNY